MRAIRHHAFGPPEVLVLEEVRTPRPSPGQVRIDVQSAGVHLLDTSIRAGKSFGAGAAPELPVVPGREVAGVVDAVGEAVPRSWLGRPVVAHLGAGGGGYAERAVVDVRRVHAVPDALDPATAVAAIGTGRTATAVLDLAGVSAGDVVAVTSAAGGLGVLLLQAVRQAGATAVGLAGGPAKLALAEAFGATVAVDYRRPDWIERVRTATAATGGVSLVLDGVGGPVGRALYDLLVPGGRLVRYGWSSGEQNAYDDPRRPVVEVLGPPILARLPELEDRALAAAADGTRVPHVGARFDLADAAQAHRALQERATTGKVVLEVRR